MSYVTFDYECPYCGRVEERFVKRSEVDAQECDHLGLPSWHQPERMKRLPAGTRTTFRFHDEALKR